MLKLSIGVQSFLVLSLFIGSIQCNVLDDENKILNNLANESKANFEKAKSLFWQAKQRAAEIETTGDGTRAKNYLNLVAYGTYSEIVKYAILHRTILAGKHLVNSRFVANGNEIIDSRGELFMASKLVPTIVSRLVMRGYADAVRYTEQLMIKLHLQIESFLGQERGDNADMILAIVQIYKQIDSFETALQGRIGEYQASLKQTLADLDFANTQAQFVVALLDRTTDEAMGCNSCSSGRAEANYFNTESMFKDEEAVHSAIAEVADKKLEDVVAVHEDVEISKDVTREDIFALLKKVLKQYDH